MIGERASPLLPSIASPDQLLKERSEINRSLLAMLKGKIDSWGIDVEAVEIKNLDLPEAMQNGRRFQRHVTVTVLPEHRHRQPLTLSCRKFFGSFFQKRTS